MGTPDGKYIFGTVKVGEKGQIVIPKDARKTFNINAGDTMLVLGDETRGIAILKTDELNDFISQITSIKSAEEE